MEKWWKVSKHSSKHVLFRGGAFFGDAVQCGFFLFVAGWPVAQERGRTFGLSLCFLVEGAKIISIPPNRFYQLWTQGVIEDDLRTFPWIGWGTNVCRLGWNDPSYPLCWGLLRVPFKANYSWISKAKKWPLATCMLSSGHMFRDSAASGNLSQRTRSLKQSLRAAVLFFSSRTWKHQPEYGWAKSEMSHGASKSHHVGGWC